MTPDDLEALLNEAAREAARERRRDRDGEQERGPTETTTAERVMAR